MSEALSLLTAINSQTGVSLFTPPSDPVAALTLAERTQDKQIDAEAKQPQVARAIDRFTKAVAAAPDAKTLLANPDVLEVLLTANGLGDQTGYPALAQKALLSNPNDSGSLAASLSNTAWKQTAATYSFATQGLTVLRQPTVLATLTHAYAEVKWRQSLDAATPGLANALTFLDTAKTATSVDAILGDSTLRTVVTTALGIPAQIAYQPLEAQEQAIATRLDVTRLQDPKFVQTLAQRYLLETQANSSSSTGSSSGLLV